MARWKSVRRGDHVELKGKDYEVTRIKTKGKRAKVTVVGAAGEFSAEVKLSDKVRRSELHDEVGAQRRWATEREAKSTRMPRGDAEVTKPPAKRYDLPWDTPRDKVERRLDTILGARLVGETDDESSGYYVPPVDVSTVAAHVALFHDADPSEHGIDDLMQIHDDQHAAALNGAPLHVNHWHTEQRPAVG